MRFYNQVFGNEANPITNSPLKHLKIFSVCGEGFSSKTMSSFKLYPSGQNFLVPLMTCKFWVYSSDGCKDNVVYKNSKVYFKSG